MRALNLLIASSITLLIAGVSCTEADDMNAGPGGIGGGGTGGGTSGGGAGTAGSGGSTLVDRDAGVQADRDASSDASVPTACELIDQAFETFVAANRSCNADSDCQMIGDCSPNVDWRAINVSAAEQGYALMFARCGYAGADGPTYAARCESGVCVEGERNGECGGPLPDAGPHDAGADDAGNGG
jgi:hypothetical protein